ncbi:MAG: MiaB/RimO family radical SAM methylthiotransferase [bacterium]|nr:MiaB/RimO family radical SAM methylthiotransferase [bacterium]
MKYFIKTFGCAANEADSQRIARFYEDKGCSPASTLKEADLVIINSCSVRQSAEHRVYGLINNLSKEGKERKIVLAGCMLRYGVSDLKKKLPNVDEFLRIGDVDFKVEPMRREKKEILVPIMEGCNQFCTYCVVPYARGRQKSRPVEDIVCEVEKIVREGSSEITLLGQNVNSYGKDFKNSKFKIQNSEVQFKAKKYQEKLKNQFSLLLSILNDMHGIKKISFLTSNPWDLGDEIIQAMKLSKVDKYLHLPVQSGDDQILRKMNRPYTSGEYINLVGKIRKLIPEIKIGTDIIVGFPGETEEQFENTVNLCRKVSFDKAYIARYSPRQGTVASRLTDDIIPKEKRRRWRILDSLINKRASRNGE